MEHLQMNYESELHQINRKLMITQNLHVAEINQRTAGLFVYELIVDEVCMLQNIYTIIFLF